MMLAKNKTDGKVRVFLMKQQETPGVASLGLRQGDDSERLRQLQDSLWKDKPKEVFFYMNHVKLPGQPETTFLVRDKFAMIGAVAHGSNKDDVALQTARLYGKEHAGDFGKMTAPEIAQWMEKSSKTITKGFEQLQKNLKTELDDGSSAKH
jgi:hypothetical protein